MARAQRKTTASRARKRTVRKKATAQKAATRKKPAAKKPAATRKTPAKKRAAGKKAGTRKAAARKSLTKKVNRKKVTTKETANKQRSSARKKTPQKKAAQRRRVRRVHVNIGGIPPYKSAAGEPYMSEPQREHFMRLLNAWKRELMEEVDRTVHHMQDEASNFPDPNDRASQESEFSLELRTRDRERKLLRKIDQTIANLEMNEYGWCEACGAEIGIRRLEARPTATLCIDCKTLDELRERQTGQ
ncbi:MAG: RNA polymerase-binding protein DksA [Gammaproteobacteria bacterium]